MARSTLFLLFPRDANCSLSALPGHILQSGALVCANELENVQQFKGHSPGGRLNLQLQLSPKFGAKWLLDFLLILHGSGCIVSSGWGSNCTICEVLRCLFIIE
jgi:hypothetical protein